VASVAVVGHSLGGRIALGASLRTPAISRVVAYEGAPLPVGAEALDPTLEARLRADLEAGNLEAMLARFMTEAIGMPAADLAAFRSDPVWPLRVAAAPTILRELEAAEHAPAAGLDALATVRVPVLQLVGSLSPAAFRVGAEALDARLPAGRLEVIEGARHGAHHSHAAEFVARVERFLGGTRRTAR
jgi:pimeloyl-ACP methyl ester carboxylesterase